MREDRGLLSASILLPQMKDVIVQPSVLTTLYDDDHGSYDTTIIAVVGSRKKVVC